MLYTIHNLTEEDHVTVTSFNYTFINKNNAKQTILHKWTSKCGFTSKHHPSCAEHYRRNKTSHVGQQKEETRNSLKLKDQAVVKKKKLLQS